MIWIIIGVSVGALWAWQGATHPAVGAPLRALTDTLADLGSKGTTAALEAVGIGPDDGIVHVLAVLASVLTPVFACLILAEALAVGRSVRRAAIIILLLAGLMSFAVLPAGSALALTALAGGASLLLLVAGGAILELPLATAVAAVAGMIALSQFGPRSVSSTGGDILAGAVGAGADLWRVALAAVAICGAAGAVARLLVRPDRQRAS